MLSFLRSLIWGNGPSFEVIRLNDQQFKEHVIQETKFINPRMTLPFRDNLPKAQMVVAKSIELRAIGVIEKCLFGLRWLEENRVTNGSNDIVIVIGGVVVLKLEEIGANYSTVRTNEDRDVFEVRQVQS